MLVHKTRFVGVVTAVVGLSGVGVLFAAPAAAPPPALEGELTIEKVVGGPAPAGSHYRIRFECSPTGQSDESVLDKPGTAFAAVEIVAAEVTADVICTVTEPGTGGADKVTFSCEEVGIDAECLAGGRLSAFRVGMLDSAKRRSR
jgi:hypothetical protein